MHFGQCWMTVDDKPIYEYFIPKSVMQELDDNLAKDIYDKYVIYAHNIKWQHKMFGYCTWSNIVRRNTDKTIDRKHELKNEDLIECGGCRGKGHSWKCEIWNGRPYVIKERENGFTDTSKINWSDPDWCKDCGGKGVF